RAVRSADGDDIEAELRSDAAHPGPQHFLIPHFIALDEGDPNEPWSGFHGYAEFERPPGRESSAIAAIAGIISGVIDSAPSSAASRAPGSAPASAASTASSASAAARRDGRQL